MAISVVHNDRITRTVHDETQGHKRSPTAFIIYDIETKKALTRVYEFVTIEVMREIIGAAEDLEKEQE